MPFDTPYFPMRFTLPTQMFQITKQNKYYVMKYNLRLLNCCQIIKKLLLPTIEQQS